MGCLQLRYQTTETPLKVAYRKPSSSENIAQGFLSVDPIAEDYPQLSTYNYASNRPETARDLEGLQAEGQDTGETGGGNQQGGSPSNAQQLTPQNIANPIDNAMDKGVDQKIKNQIQKYELLQSKLEALKGVNEIVVVHNIDGKQTTAFQGAPNKAPLDILNQAARIVQSAGSGENGSITFTTKGLSQEVAPTGIGNHTINTYANVDVNYSFDLGGDRMQASGSFNVLADQTGISGLPEAALTLVGLQLAKMRIGPALGASEASSVKAGKELFNFTETTMGHMNNPGRRVPVSILDDAINSTKGVVDPQGTDALMHYTRMSRGGKMYNLEVLHDKSTNTILHFEYSRKAMGSLSAIPK